MAAWENFHYQMWCDAVQERQSVLSDQRIDLTRLCRTKAGKGEATMLPSIAHLAATLTAYGADTGLQADLKDKKTRADYERDGTKALADLQALLTPHLEVSKIQTVSTPKHHETGHTFDSSDDILEWTSTQSATLNLLLDYMNGRKNKMVFSAITAASVNRGRNLDDTSAVAFSTDGHVTDLEIGDMDRRVFTDIRVKFGKAGVPLDRGVYCLISWDDWGKLYDNAEDVKIVMNKDFVDPTQHYFQTGKFPEIAGVQILPWDQVPADEYYAWCHDAITYVPYKELSTQIAPDAGKRFQPTAYMEQVLDAKRTDDKLVLHGTISPVPDP